MRPDDIALLRVPAAPCLHGDLLLVDLAAPDLTADAYVGGLWRVPLDGAPAQPWTRGERDSSPAISPDGRTVAFLRRERGVAQLYVMPADGGEPVRLTELPGGAGAPVWAPDSRRIAFVARVPEPGRYGTEGAPVAEGEAPRRITRLDYRLDNTGFLLDRPQQLFVAELDGPVRQLTEVDCDLADPAWTEDGERLVVVAPRALGERPTLHFDLYLVPSAGGTPELAVRTEGESYRPVVHGRQVYYLGVRFAELEWLPSNHGLWVADLAGGTPRRLTDEETVDCEPDAGAPVVTAEGVLLGVRNRGAVELRRVPLDADGLVLEQIPVLAGERAQLRSFAHEAGRTVAVLSTSDSPGEVVLVGKGKLTDFAEPLRSSGLHPVRELAGDSADGYPVHGWLVLPEGPGPHPVLLAVHGGPFMYHGWGFFDEAQVYASAGYAVVLPNPRGSAGYGQRHGRSIVRALGTVDAQDVLALLDVALALPECDPGQVGVMGGSYGGFMTGWLAAHHGHRFRAAWSERAVNAWDSFTGSSDIGWWFAEVYCGSDPAEQRAVSPLSYADRIGIPFAVVHSEQDWRCPVEQAQRLFVALMRNGVETELLLFPGEGHELTRSGRPQHRRQRFEAVLRWWSRQLNSTGS
ncbi:S9 family peptidase [Kutzneria albida]|uniref:Peptidase S9 prolyl oligopeptidase catalytic domain-containing protein n=1 Tax=Kutzneria albida DSM 43870 TaxID=1449976 RepID=W5WHQ9_9PSEU|nr:S9 family peptidase [Kutzneria albida]AHI00117.1 hypothetical protein KALB_6758 [Kutzneria albida DSM 43870]